MINNNKQTLLIKNKKTKKGNWQEKKDYRNRYIMIIKKYLRKVRNFNLI